MMETYATLLSLSAQHINTKMGRSPKNCDVRSPLYFEGNLRTPYEEGNYLYPQTRKRKKRSSPKQTECASGRIQIYVQITRCFSPVNNMEKRGYQVS
jgi:hypothetical protein